MKKYIVLVVTTLILTGLAGCSMTKNRYNHYGVVKYLENKYDDKFEYYETYGGTLFDSDSWKKFICTSEKYPGKHILVIYDVNHDAYHDNYFEIKYAHQVDGLIDSMLSEVFGDDPYYFRHYEGADVSGLVSQYDADTTFEEYIAEENLSLTAFIKSDKSNEEIESKLKKQILTNGIFCGWIARIPAKSTTPFSMIRSTARPVNTGRYKVNATVTAARTMDIPRYPQYLLI